MVFSIALRITGDRGTAEEVAQDVFLDLFRWWDRLESQPHAAAWLRRVAVHRAIDAARRSTRIPVGASKACDLAVEVERKDPLLARRLREQVAQLPEQMRVAIVLRYQEDMTPTEIAEALNMPVATVKSNLQRGLFLLRRKTQGALRCGHG